MAGSAGKTKIAVDTGTLADGDSIAAYLVAGGTQLTATGTALDVNVTASALPTGAATEATLASVLADTTAILADTASIDSVLTALSKAEDAAHASGDQGIMALVVRNDVAGSLAGADGDYAPLQVD